MGFRFDLETANWLAFVIEPHAPIPPLETAEQYDNLYAFLATFSEHYYSSQNRDSELGRIARLVLDRISVERTNSRVIADAMGDLRNYFGARFWTGLIIPSGDNPDIDRYLCSPDFLRQLLAQTRFPGLILQLTEPPPRRLSLEHIFPAFQIALSDSSSWPGMLVWSRQAQGSFFPFITNDPESIIERVGWITEKLRTGYFPNDPTRIATPSVADVRQLYMVAFPDTRPTGTKLHLLQISDIHLGSVEAGVRLSLVEQHVKNLVRELNDGIVVPIVTGDLMDSPSDTNLDAVRLFFRFLNDLGVASPLAVLGNHDVRKDGWLQRILGKALQVPVTHGMNWYDDARVGVACFNSVVDGKLARGFIGERQRIDITTQINQSVDRKEFAIVGVLHHHPMPVEMPDWMTRPSYERFYERFIGQPFEKTTILEDASAFVQYVEATEMAAVLHGHEHIPNIGETPKAGIPIFGCGSSVGKVRTKNANETCISLNVVTLDSERQHLTGRVLAERVVGAGLSPFSRHEMVYRKRSNWVHKALER